MKGTVRTAVVGIGLAVVVACLDDAPSQASNDEPVAIVLRAIADLGAAVDRDVGIRVFYNRSSGEQVDLPSSPARVRVTGGETVRQPVSVQLATCLADPLRIDATLPGCRLNVELRLLDEAGTTLDVAVSRPEAPSSPGQTVDAPPVSLAEVASVRIAEVPTLRTQDSRALSATALASNGQPIGGRSFQWTSGNTGVATITPEGTLTAIAPGTATISATTGIRSGDATVRVLARVTSVTVTAPSATMLAGTSQQLTVVARDAAGSALTDLAQRTVAWQSSAPSVAAVSAQGVVTALRAGTAQITGTVDGVSGNTTITATVSPITITPANDTVIVARSVQLQAEGAIGAVQWSTSDASVAEVSASGLVTGRFPGAATITATTAAGQSTTKVIQARPLFTSVSRGSLESISLGRTIALRNLQAFDGNGAEITGIVPIWSVAPASPVLTVAPSGAVWNVTGTQLGSATVVARDSRTNALIRSDTYTVLTPIQGANGALFITNDIGSSISLGPGESYTIGIQVYDMTGKPQPNRIITASAAPAPGSFLTFPGRARTNAFGEATFQLVAGSGFFTTTITFAAEGDPQAPATLVVFIGSGG